MASITKGPMDRFFQRYVQYRHNPDAPVWAEYERMSKTFGYTKGNKKDTKARTLLRQAIVDEFEAINDTDENDLPILQRLCQRLEISPPPRSVRYRDDMKALAMGNIACDAIVRTAGPIDRFFNWYDQFGYDPHSQVWNEYNRLCGFFGWLKGSPEENAARNLFRQALVDEFGAIYGENDDKLDVLQQLCRKVEIDPIPQSITACKKAIKGVYVNIVDFIDCERTGEPIHKFASLAHLRRYTKKGKVFPREQAKRSLLLRFLLQVLFGRKRGQ
ncbi:hypothetical protein E4U23_006467 [Claviceps purpurea]|nr:hypothetical protein E4U10_007004 [Claviceps purpurea]KAG6254326.1 hypothetical protein E4U23_006467 [Claviceps purpurea]KAG6289711.1 hypothetical protein E4U45_007538 [Claviceps purpurea]